jgi:hypothetical protein
MPYLAGSTRRPVGMLYFGTAGGTRRIEDARFTPAKWRGRLCGIAKRVFHRVEPRASRRQNINFGFETRS